MKNASAALLSILDSGQCYMADMFDLTLITGDMLRLTSAPQALDWNGASYVPAVLERSATRLVAGLEVDSLELTIANATSIALAGSDLLSIASTGGLDGASLLLRRAVMSTWGDTSSGLLHLFSGRVGNVDTHRAAARLSVNSDVELLDVELPRRVFQPGCIYQLYGMACNATPRNVGCTVQAGSTDRLLIVGGGQISSYPFGYFNGGVVTFTNGALLGVTAAVKQHNALDRIMLTVPLPALPAVGSTFNICAGCPKSYDVCESRFQNGENFSGFPFVPKPATLL